MQPRSKRQTPAPTQSKTAILIDLLARPGGATLQELTRATGWQTHSVRGAIAGTLKRKGHIITTEKTDSVRRYWIEAPQ